MTEHQKNRYELNVAINAEANGRKEQTDAISGRVVLLARATLINIKDNPVMNGILYTRTAINESDWNGVRITNGHPEYWMDISANAVGSVTNTEYDTQTGRLNALLVIDKMQAEAHNSINLYNRVLKGEKMDVSITVFIKDLEEIKGEANGTEYKGIVSAMEPNALAILPDSEGACSQPNCGINKKQTPEAKPSLLRKVKDLLSKQPKEVKTMTQETCANCAQTLLTNQNIQQTVADIAKSVQTLADNQQKSTETFAAQVNAVLDEREASKAKEAQNAKAFDKAVATQVAKCLAEKGIPIGNATDKADNGLFFASGAPRPKTTGLNGAAPPPAEKTA